MKKIIILFLSAAILFGQEFLFETHGEIDDDIFVYKTSHKSGESKFVFAAQMHNPDQQVILDGVVVPTEMIYGTLDEKETYPSSADEVVTITIANEREEINSLPYLYSRTHFKSSDIVIDGKIFIPAANPDLHTHRNFPKWLEYDGGSCLGKSEKTGGNYYVLWENAVVQVGIITPTTGSYRIVYINEGGEILHDQMIEISLKMKQVKSFAGKHDFTEGTGHLYHKGDLFDLDKEKVEKSSVKKILLIENKTGHIYPVPLIYPWPYLNMLYIKGMR